MTEVASGTANLSSSVPPRDASGNELSRAGKWIAGTLLIGFTIFSALYIVGHWPDRLATPRESIKPLYTYKWFHVKLVDSIIDPGKRSFPNALPIIEKTGKDTSGLKKDTSRNAADSIRQPPIKSDSALQATAETQRSAGGTNKFYSGPEDKLIHINTLLLILVATGGFLGNMIYLATSFTTFVGNGEFKKSWILWYVVKPFTAAGLAIAIYFVFRGGFLNMSDDSTNINLYGLMTISILAGLFTDRTTLKLKEVFDVLLQPKEERAHPLGETPKIASISPEFLELNKEVTITIAGKNLDKKNLKIKIDGSEVPSINKPDLITFSYTVPQEAAAKESVKLEIVDDKETPVQAPVELKIKKP